jgi:hypothetical protein
MPCAVVDDFVVLAASAGLSHDPAAAAVRHDEPRSDARCMPQIASEQRLARHVQPAAVHPARRNRAGTLGAAVLLMSTEQPHRPDQSPETPESRAAVAIAAETQMLLLAAQAMELPDARPLLDMLIAARAWRHPDRPAEPRRALPPIPPIPPGAALRIEALGDACDRLLYECCIGPIRATPLFQRLGETVRRLSALSARPW